MTHLSGNDFPIDGRLRLFAALLGAVFAIFELRLFQLQVVEAQELRERSLRNSVRTVRLEAPRGEIVDREGRTLADTRSAWELSVVPNDLQRRDVTCGARLEEAFVGWHGGNRLQKFEELQEFQSFTTTSRRVGGRTTVECRMTLRTAAGWDNRPLPAYRPAYAPTRLYIVSRSSGVRPAASTSRRSCVVVRMSGVSDPAMW